MLQELPVLNTEEQPTNCYIIFYREYGRNSSENMRDVYSLVIGHIFSQENLFDFIILPLVARDMRNLSHELTAATRINLYKRVISHMFSYCEHVLQTSRKLSVSGLTLNVVRSSHA